MLLQEELPDKTIRTRFIKDYGLKGCSPKTYARWLSAWIRSGGEINRFTHRSSSLLEPTRPMPSALPELGVLNSLEIVVPQELTGRLSVVEPPGASRLYMALDSDEAWTSAISVNVWVESIAFLDLEPEHWNNLREQALEQYRGEATEPIRRLRQALDRAEEEVMELDTTAPPSKLFRIVNAATNRTALWYEMGYTATSRKAVQAIEQAIETL